MIDHDALFKAVIAEFFLEFLQLFFPDLAADLDPASIVEKEQEIMTDIKGGQTNRVDLIREVKVDNEPSLVLILVEPQSYDDKNFSKRLFRYVSRLYDKYDLPVFPVAVLSYASPKAKAPNSFQVGIRNYKTISFNYETIQLNQLDWQEYADKPNPIASAFLAKMPVKKKERVKLKLVALTKLTELGLNPAQQRLLTGFIDTYLDLNFKEEVKFAEELSKIEGEKKEAVMELTTSWERKGIIQGKREGIKEGIIEGKREGEINLLVKQLTRRYGPLTSAEESGVQGLEQEQLEGLAEAILDFQSREEFTIWLDKAQS